MPTTIAQVVPPRDGCDDVLPMEFLNLPMHQESTLDATQHDDSTAIMIESHSGHAICVPETKARLKQSLQKWHDSQQVHVARVRNGAHDVPDARQRLKRRIAARTALPNASDTDVPSVDIACFASHGSLVRHSGPGGY